MNGSVYPIVGVDDEGFFYWVGYVPSDLYPCVAVEDSGACGVPGFGPTPVASESVWTSVFRRVCYAFPDLFTIYLPVWVELSRDSPEEEAEVEFWYQFARWLSDGFRSAAT